MTAAGTSSRGPMIDDQIHATDHTERNLWLALAGVVVLLVALVAWLLHTQAPKRTPVMASDGKVAWLIECSSPGDCVRESALTCPRGYDTVAQGASTEHTVVNTGKVMVPVDTFSGAMVIRCVAER